MNRRGFLSMLAGAAGAPLVPWRALDKALIFLPNAASSVDLNENSVEQILNHVWGEPFAIRPTQLIMSPAGMRRVLEPSLRAHFEAAYGKIPQDFVDLYAKG